jgi:hypothetical protein
MLQGMDNDRAHPDDRSRPAAERLPVPTGPPVDHTPQPVVPSATDRSAGRWRKALIGGVAAASLAVTGGLVAANASGSTAATSSVAGTSGSTGTGSSSSSSSSGTGSSSTPLVSSGGSGSSVATTAGS